ncbi:Uma2 family endonuclease [Hydrogenimonas thermophila]|uniref:Uma2 family endonuclease n=1 Tax=Hydrogenimonas thermophila TaxID=223786 RepID=UPI0029373588|nr:Uma2 family endonuclease [Hydrogenimonas thermophila]WOE69172.1 Uma2 family endonuclease [Hydrogenimonas thermophila]WOE71682.1 Uma2 family endonuclease [Hydrogenimonas thermophila]
MISIKLEDINYTYDDYKLWEGDWELIEGIPFALSPSPICKHQSILVSISSFLLGQLEECHNCEVLGRIDYKISERTVVRPDVVLVCNEKNEAYLTKAPEIIVEIISKSTAKKDEVYKFDLYETEKVKYYIIVYPDDLRAKIYKHNGEKYIKEGDFFDESYFFEETTCKVNLDFKKVFKKFRN